MRRLLSLTLAAGFAALPAIAQPPKAPAAFVTPGPGQRGHIPDTPPEHSVLDHGILLLVPRRGVDLTLGEKNAMTMVHEFAAGETRFKDGFAQGTLTPAGWPIPKSGQVTITAETPPVGNTGVFVWVENGTKKPISLIVVLSMKSGGRRVSSPATFCDVRPGESDYTYWKPKVDVIQVIQILDSPKDACFDPVARGFYQRGTKPPSGAVSPTDSFGK